MTYGVYCIHSGREAWVDSLRRHLDAAVADLDAAVTDLEGVTPAVRVHDGLPAKADRDANFPAVTVYLGSPAGAVSAECGRQVDEALADRLLVLPVVDSNTNFKAHTPEALHPFNGVEWPAEEAPPEVVHFILEALGLEDSQRLVFLSHRRSDALALAEQLHDKLIKSRFWPFVDRFDIDPAANVQQRIYAALEETAFVVLVESPDTGLSKWVLEEVHYALRESLGILIISFPEVDDQLRGTEDLPRFDLAEGDLVPDSGGQRVLTADALGRVVQRIEAIHAKALVRRRRRLVLHTRAAAEKADLVVAELPHNVMLVREPPAALGKRPRYLVHFAPRPPQPKDLYALDSARDGHGGQDIEAVLVHATSQLPKDSSDLLDWCGTDRNIRLIADHLVGTAWINPPEGER